MASKRRFPRWKITIAIVAIIVGGGWGAFKIAEVRVSARAEHAASRLRKLGYPTTITEFRARLPKDGPDNAAPLYREAMKLMEQIGTPPFEKGSWDGKAYRELDEIRNDPQKRADVAKAMEPVYQMLVRAAALPHCVFERKWEDVHRVPFPEFAHLRNFYRICVNRAEHESANQDWRRALESLSVAVRVAGHIREPHLYGHTNSDAGEIATLEGFYSVLARHRENPQFLVAAREWLTTLPPPTDRLRAYDFEIAGFREGLKLLETDTSRAPFGRFGWRRHVLFSIYVRSTYGKRSAEALHFNRLYANLAAPYEDPWRDVKQWSDLDEQLEADRSSVNIAASAYVPTFGAIQSSFAQGATHRRLADVALWACEQRVQLGTFPYQLPDQERFHDPWTGKRLIYSTSGDQFRIRSVGPNKVDDGGQTSGGTRTDDDEVIIDPAKVR